MDNIEEYIIKKEYKKIKDREKTKERDLQDYFKIKNFKKYNGIYNKVNDIYLSEYTTLNNACKNAHISKKTYYRACEMLNKDSIVKMVKKANKKNIQRGGNKNMIDINNEIMFNNKYKLIDELGKTQSFDESKALEKKNIIDDDKEYKNTVEYINKMYEKNFNNRDE